MTNPVTSQAQHRIDKNREEEKESPPNPPRKRVGKPALPADDVALPDWIPADVWAEFVEMRKKLKVPSPQSFRHIVKELDRLRGLGHSPEAVLSRSIMNSWAGVFAIPAERSNGFHGNEKAKPPEPIHVIKESLEEHSRKLMAKAKEQEEQSRREGLARKNANEHPRPK